MSDLSLRYLLFGEDRTASKSLKGVGAQAGATSNLVGKSLSGIGSMVGGEVGMMIDRVATAFDDVGNRAKGMGPKLAAGGTAVMGLGVAMQAMASGDIESMNQLNAAVEATGKGYDSFGSDVEKLIQKQVAFGNTDDQVTTALRVLTQAYGDPKKAMAEMAVTTDLAAAKHISLSQAAGLVAKVHGGAGKVLKEFGLALSTTTTLVKAVSTAEKSHQTAVENLDKAQKALADLEAKDHAKKKLTIADQQALAAAHDRVKVAQDKVKATMTTLTTATAANAKGVTAGDEALTKLAVKLKGQASASMDSFGGKVKIATTWLTNQASSLSAKYGPAVTMAGVVITALGTVMQILAARQAAAALATDTATVAVARQSLGSKIAAAAQWLWNAALTANPIGLVIAAIALLVGAIYLVATKTTWLQTAWQYMTSSLATAWQWLWNSVLAPVIRFILNGFATVTSAIGHVLVALGHIPTFGWATDAGNRMLGAANQARNMANNIKNIPSHVPVNVAFTGNFSWLGQQVASALGNVNKLAAMSHRASGGPVTAGTAYLVGESGPEVFVPGSSGGIIPNGGGGSPAGGGSGGSSQPLVVQFMLDGRVLHQSLLALRRTTGGGLALG